MKLDETCSQRHTLAKIALETAGNQEAISRTMLQCTLDPTRDGLPCRRVDHLVQPIQNPQQTATLSVPKVGPGRVPVVRYIVAMGLGDEKLLQAASGC
jgi:hypothetical protein